MRLITHAVMAICAGVGVAIGMVVGLILYLALFLAACALLLLMTWALLMLALEGTAYLITHSHHAKVEALTSIAVLLGGFAMFGMAGYVVQAVKLAVSERHARRTLERMGELRLERDEPFEPATPYSSPDQGSPYSPNPSSRSASLCLGARVGTGRGA